MNFHLYRVQLVIVRNAFNTHTHPYVSLEIEVGQWIWVHLLNFNFKRRIEKVTGRLVKQCDLKPDFVYVLHQKLSAKNHVLRQRWCQDFGAVLSLGNNRKMCSYRHYIETRTYTHTHIWPPSRKNFWLYAGKKKRSPKWFEPVSQTHRHG